MSGPAPLINQLHKLAVLRKRASVTDNELYEMMRSRQVYHVQTDLQKRLGETIRSLEHDRELALAGMLSRRLIFLKQAGKRERKRRKLIDVRKHMDDILRDEDLDQMGATLHQVVGANQTDSAIAADADGFSHSRNRRDLESLKREDKLLAKPSTALNDFSQVKPNVNVLKIIPAIEKGIELYLDSRETSFEAAQREKIKKRAFRANTLPTLLQSAQSTENGRVKTVAVQDHLSHSCHETEQENKITGQGLAPPTRSHFLQHLHAFQNPVQSKNGVSVTEKGNDIVKQKDKKSFNSVKLVMYKESNERLRKPDSNEHRQEKELEKYNCGKQFSLENSLIHPQRLTDKTETSFEKSPTPQKANKKHDDLKSLHGHKETVERKGEKEQTPGTKGEGANRCSAVLKSLPPYLESKASRPVEFGTRTSTTMTTAASSSPLCDRSCLERTVSMIFVEDSDVEKPKSSFDVEAWLAFIRKKKGYSATLTDGPLEGVSDEQANKPAGSKRSVKFELRKRKRRPTRPACKTCRDRALEWFREFTKSNLRGRRRSSTHESDLTEDESERFPKLQTVGSRSSGKLQTETSRPSKESKHHLLKKLREDKRILQEKVQHLCTDEYWKFWSNDGAGKDWRDSNYSKDRGN